MYIFVSISTVGMGVLNTPDPQIYLVLMVRIWASLGSESSTSSIYL